MRLFEDACALRKDRRYASATALAILSLEEVGKFALTHDQFDLRLPTRKGRARNFHREKQWAAALMIKGVMGIDEVEALIGTAGYHFVLVPAGQKLENEISAEDVIAGIEDQALDLLLTNSKFGNHLKFLVHLLRGEFDDLKKKCFYVDDDKDGLIVSGPDEIDRQTSDGAMRTAKKAIWATKIALRRYSRINPARIIEALSAA